MSNILPASAVLPVKRENETVSQTFSANLTEPGATLVSLEISAIDQNEGIVIVNNGFSGQYTGVFTLNGGLSYRLKTGERETANKWEDLPDPQTTDLYSFLAPKVMEKEYSYLVVLTYDVVTPTEPGNPPSEPVRYVINKTYTQKVVGEWNTWANNLRDYVNRGR